MPNGDPISIIVSPQAQAGLDAANASLEKTIQLLVSANDTVKGLEAGLRAAGSLREVINGQREVADSVRNVSRANKEAQNALKAQRAEEKEWQRMLKEEAADNRRAAKERADALKAEERQRKEYEKWWAQAIRERQKLEREAARERERINNIEARRAETDINQRNREAGTTTSTPGLDALAAARRRNAAAMSAEAAEVARLNAATSAANATNRQAALSVNYAADSLAQMRINLTGMQQQWDLMTAAERNNAQVGGALTTQMQNLNREIARGEQVSGRYARANASSFNALGNSIQQVGRELPNFAVSARLGFLAISNNLPILQDAIRQTRLENARLRLEGQATVPVYKQIIKSIVNWQTGLIILITFMVKYSEQIGEFFSELVHGKKALSDLELQQKAYNAALTESAPKTAKLNADLSVMKTRFMDASASVSDKEAIVKELNKSYGSTIGKINGINEAEAFFVNKTEAYIRATTLRAQADGAKELISKNFQTQLERESKSVDESQSAYRKLTATIQATINPAYTSQRKRGRVFQSIGEIRDEILKTDKEVKDMEASSVMEQQNSVFTNMIAGWEREAAAIETKFGFNPVKPKPEKTPKPTDTTKAEVKADSDMFKYKSELLKEELRQKIEADKTIMESEVFSYEERLEAADNFSKDRLALLEEDQKQEMGIIKVSLDKIAEIEKLDQKKRTNQQNSLLDQKESLDAKYALASKKYEDELVKTERENSEARVKVTEDEFKRRSELLKVQIAEEAEARTKRMEAELQAKAAEFAGGGMTPEAYQKAQQAIVRKYQTEEFNYTLDLFDKEIEAARMKGATVTNLTKESADLRRKIEEEASKAIIESYEAEAAARKELVESFKALGKQIADTLFQIADKSLEKDKSDLEAKKGRVSEELDIELSRIEQTTEAGVEREEKIIDAKAEAAAKEKQIALQQEVIDKRRIELNKAAQIVSALAQSIQTGVFLQAKVFELTTMGLQYGAQAGARGAVGDLAGSIAFGAAAAAAGSAAGITQAQIPILAALTLSQIAGIAAFAKGTEFSPEGLAFVGEEGHEIRINPDGKASLTPSTATLTYLKEGTKIIPNHEIEAWAANYAGIPKMIPQSNGGAIDTKQIISAIGGLGSDVTKAIKNKRENQIIITGMGLQHMVRTGANSNTYIHSLKH